MPLDEQVDRLQTPVRFVKGVGEARAGLLARMDVETVWDLLLLLPRRYEDRRRFMRIADLHGQDLQTVAGHVVACGWVPPRRGKAYFEVALDDGSGVVECRWFGARYLKDQIRTGDRLIVYGKVAVQRGRATFQHPEFEREEGEGESLHMDRIVPVYPSTEDLSQRILRRILFQAVEEYADAVTEVLSDEARIRQGLPTASDAIRQVHFPASLEEAEQARQKLVFDEFLAMQVVLAARKVQTERLLPGITHNASGVLRQQLIDRLPFRMTAAQERVIGEIVEDLRKPHPMHRLLQGDVGSGKTLVAACVLLDAIECGSQGAVMAPTDVLAEQHAHTFKSYLEPLGIRMALLTGDIQGRARDAVLRRIAEGDAQLVIGTHALIQQGVEFKALGLAVIDEQHKFGVEQRSVLSKKGEHPDVLVMTATPIPRTLAMTVYGDLDVSILDELPAGRAPIVTRVIRENQLPDAYGFIRKQVEKGRQAFIIYPLVEGSESSTLRAATDMYKSLCEGVFKTLRVGLVHGRLAPADKAAAMDGFHAGDMDVLVATTVVEVGIDVPNATVMLIEHAERFGLAQLHQLRGRVGRGSAKSFCILQGDPKSPDSWRRLRIMEETTDGFRIAEEDLELRGMGNLLGREQSGVPLLRVGRPMADPELLRRAREEALAIAAADPKLKDPANQPLRARAKALYKEVGALLGVG